VKLGKKRRESSKRNYYIISPRVIIKTIIIKLYEGMEGVKGGGGRRAIDIKGGGQGVSVVAF
jgi:hypothetical protein